MYLCFFFSVSLHVIGTYCPKWYFIVGQIVPLVFSYCKMNKFFFCYFQIAKNESQVKLLSFCLGIAVMMMRPQSHRIHLLVRIAAKQALVRVKILCRKCNNLVVVMMTRQGHNHQQVVIPLRMIRNGMLHVILLFGINLQLLSHPSFPLMTTSHANLQLQCLQHYRKLIPSKFSFKKSVYIYCPVYK